MPISGIYVIPHGDELIDNPSEGSVKLRKHIENIASADNSETLLILSPHGLRLKNRISVINTEWLRAGYSTETRVLQAKYKTDRELVETILTGLENYTEEIQFVTSSGDLSVFPIDFGTAIPLSFFTNDKVVSMGQTRVFDRDFLVQFGMKLAQILSEGSKRTGVILSADQAHTHWEGGPYGYSEKASDYDSRIIRSINSNDFQDMLQMTEEYIDAAKPDSYWNMLILSGILKQTGRKLKVLDYYVEKYFGMLVAAEQV